MNLKLPTILLAIFGQALIVLAFLWVLPANLFVGPPDRWLDFSVISIVYWLWVWITVVPPVRADDPSQRHIGGLGIKWSAILVYSIFAVGAVAVFMYRSHEGEPVAFKVQAMLQAAVLFVLLLALLLSATSTQKTAQVFAAEQQKMGGKVDLRYALQNIVNKAEDNTGVPHDFVARLKALSADTRYITPSASPAAADADNRVLADCEALAGALYDFEINKQYATQMLAQLERDFRRRRAL